MEQCALNLFRGRVSSDNLISSAKLLLLLDASAVIKVLTLPFKSGLRQRSRGSKKWAAVTIPSEVSTIRKGTKIKEEDK